jgi:hypothetical protein
VSRRRTTADLRTPPALPAGNDRQGRRMALEAARRRYGGLSAAGKRRLLDELQGLTGDHRKSLMRLLNRPDPVPPLEPGGAADESVKPHHRRRYSPDVVKALVPLWEASDRLCGKRLQALLPLLAMSSDPGWLEIDLLAHCGGRMEGRFLWTLMATDIATGWSESLPIVMRDGAVVITALQLIRRQLPFQLRRLQRRTDPLVLLETIRRCQGHSWRCLPAVSRTPGWGLNPVGRIERRRVERWRCFWGICRRCGTPASRVAANPGREPESGRGPNHSRPT